MRTATYTIPAKPLIMGITILVVWITGIFVTPMIDSISHPVADFLYFIYKPVCHQLEDRSAIINGLPATVCLRCSSFYLAGAVVFIYYLIRERVSFWTVPVYLVLILPVFADFALEKAGMYSNISLLRIITGLMLGIAFFQLLVLSICNFDTDRLNPGIESR